jgi:hypothetical protein
MYSDSVLFDSGRDNLIIVSLKLHFKAICSVLATHVKEIKSVLICILSTILFK